MPQKKPPPPINEELEKRLIEFKETLHKMRINLELYRMEALRNNWPFDRIYRKYLDDMDSIKIKFDDYFSKFLSGGKK